MSAAVATTILGLDVQPNALTGVEYVPVVQTVNGVPGTYRTTIDQIVALAGSGSGTVTTVSVVSANGFAGSVASPTTTPSITISTTITGVLKGNGVAISAATAGTDYSSGTSGLATGILKSTTTTGALTIAVAGDFPTLNQNTTGSAASLTTGRTISITGDLAYTSPSFDGTGNITAAGTLATVNSNVGSFGSSTSIPSLTVNAKGLITAASGNVVIAPAGTLTGTTLNATVVTSSLTSVGTIATGVWQGTVVSPVYGGTGVSNNVASTITISGSFGATFTLTGTTSVTFPTSGTLSTTTGTVTTTGSPASGNLTQFSGASSITNGNLSGDITTTNTLVTTLATVNANVGSFGSSTAIPSFTVNAKGLITAASTNVVIAPAGTLTGTTLAANVVTSSLTSVGTIGTGVWQGTKVGLLYGGTNADLSATGGTNFVVQQASVGAAFTVAQLGASQLSNGITGIGAVVLAQAPTFIGDPTISLSNGTNLPVSTGISGLGTGVATWLATPSSANLAAAVTGETGSGALVFATSPALVTPNIGVATATSVNGLTISSSTGTLTITNGKVVSVSNTLTFTGTDSSSVAFGVGGTVAYLATTNAFTKQQYFAATTLTSTSNSIAWDVGSNQIAAHTATENTTLANPTNMVNGGVYIFQFTQAAAAKTLAFGNLYVWPGGVAPTVSTNNGGVDIFTFFSNGSLMFGTVLQNFS